MQRLINKVTSARFLMSIGITTVLCIMAVRGDVSSEAFIGIAGTVIGYYFNKDRKE